MATIRKNSSLIKGILVLFFVSFLISCEKDNTTQHFVTQQAYPDLMCGAYCIAYYNWLSNDKTQSENEAEERSEVKAIYNQIKFGDAYNHVTIDQMGTQDLSATSDPLKILNFVVENLNKSNSKLYYDGSNAALIDIKNTIQIHDGALMSQYSDDILSTGIPTLQDGQYAIVLFLIGEQSMHWMLCHKKENEFYLYDPYVGFAQSIKESQVLGTEPLEHSKKEAKKQSLNSCILIE